MIWLFLLSPLGQDGGKSQSGSVVTALGLNKPFSRSWLMIWIFKFSPWDSNSFMFETAFERLSAGQSNVSVLFLGQCDRKIYSQGVK